MSTSITIELSDPVRSALDDAIRAEGVSVSEIVDQALRRHLFLRRFRGFQAEMLAHMREIGQGELTDDDVLHNEDLLYRSYVREKVRSGLEDADMASAVEQDDAEA